MLIERSSCAQVLCKRLKVHARENIAARDDAVVVVSVIGFVHRWCHTYLSYFRCMYVALRIEHWRQSVPKHAENTCCTQKYQAKVSQVPCDGNVCQWYTNGAGIGVGHSRRHTNVDAKFMWLKNHVSCCRCARVFKLKCYKTNICIQVVYIFYTYAYASINLPRGCLSCASQTESCRRVSTHRV